MKSVPSEKTGPGGIAPGLVLFAISGRERLPEVHDRLVAGGRTWLLRWARTKYVTVDVPPGTLESMHFLAATESSSVHVVELPILCQMVKRVRLGDSAEQLSPLGSRFKCGSSRLWRENRVRKLRRNPHLGSCLSVARDYSGLRDLALGNAALQRFFIKEHRASLLSHPRQRLLKSFVAALESLGVICHELRDQHVPFVLILCSGDAFGELFGLFLKPIPILCQRKLRGRCRAGDDAFTSGAFGFRRRKVRFSNARNVRRDFLAAQISGQGLAEASERRGTDLARNTGPGLGPAHEPSEDAAHEEAHRCTPANTEAMPSALKFRPIPPDAMCISLSARRSSAMSSSSPSQASM